MAVKTKSVIGIPVEQEMLDVVNLKPGQSAQFLLYTVHFIDLKNPVGFEHRIDALLEDASSTTCKRAASGLPQTYIDSAQARSRYLIVALSTVSPTSVGAFVLARPDSVDPDGIYVEVSCNIPGGIFERPHPLYQETKNRLTDQVRLMSPEEVVSEHTRLYPTSIPITVHQLGVKTATRDNNSLYRSMIVTRTLKNMGLNPSTYDLNIRTAQLLKLAMFNYANSLGMKHAYNAASGLESAATHARNGMTIRSTNCGQYDQLAELFISTPPSERIQYMETLAKEGKFKLDKSESYPMKLCNYNFNVLFAELLDHTIGVLLKLEKAGINTDEIRKYDITF